MTELVSPQTGANLQTRPANTARTSREKSVARYTQYCVFERKWGEQLGLAIEAGNSQTFLGPAGQSFDTFGHEVTIEVLGFEVESTVFFAKDPEVRRSVLGRVGWLNKFRIALVDHDRQLYLSPYNE